MYQTINEDIAVLGIYKNSFFVPKKFKWNHRVYGVQEITLLNDVSEGSIKKRLYSVVSNGNLYRLEFNRSSEKWRIAEVWVE